MLIKLESRSMALIAGIAFLAIFLGISIFSFSYLSYIIFGVLICMLVVLLSDLKYYGVSFSLNSELATYAQSTNKNLNEILSFAARISNRKGHGTVVSRLELIVGIKKNVVGRCNENLIYEDLEYCLINKCRGTAIKYGCTLALDGDRRDLVLKAVRHDLAGLRLGMGNLREIFLYGTKAFKKEKTLLILSPTEMFLFLNAVALFDRASSVLSLSLLNGGRRVVDCYNHLDRY